MAQHAIDFLIRSGITRIILSINSEDRDDYLSLIVDEYFDQENFVFHYQTGADGTAKAVADALKLVETEFVLTLWGDSLFEYVIGEQIEDFISQTYFPAQIHIYKTDQDATQFGVVELKDGPDGDDTKFKKVLRIEEKPLWPTSNIIFAGVFISRTEVLIEAMKNLEVDRRGEYDMNQVFEWLIVRKWLSAWEIEGWNIDAGTSFANLLAAGNLASQGINKEPGDAH